MAQRPSGEAEPREDDMARTVTVQTTAGMKAEATAGPHRVIFDAPPEAKTLFADGALFIGRIKAFVVDEKVIV